MDECKTLDELIAALEKQRKELGGDTRVAHRGIAGLSPLRVGRTNTGKATPFKVVSRGGQPVVVIWA